MASTAQIAPAAIPTSWLNAISPSRRASCSFFSVGCSVFSSDIALRPSWDNALCGALGGLGSHAANALTHTRSRNAAVVGKRFANVSWISPGREGTGGGHARLQARSILQETLTMSTFKANDQLTNGLIEIITVAMQRNQVEEAEAVLGAVRLLRPNVTALDSFDAWLAIKRGRFADAARLLRSLDVDKDAPPISKALRACCLFAIGDSDWTISANEVILENRDPDAVALVKMLSGQPVEQREPSAADGEAAASPAVDIATLGYVRA
ncbi:HrpB1 family type III secretion system apparatus protein [Xanthomonas cerealis pv. cerealis]|uniref:HrpB1 family type III secretion system apparatus protein n=1 Tax=Xanthomonas cerealis TaxID=3390025 RepID=UPI001F35ADB6|nr:HrpB1 family type III secretion system apparatus protein [Xanthomonas translucens]UKE70477.1 HrpB1 family type III secretion system apparatus protein [Xanthomonas translucens pv. pistacia]